MNANNLLMYMVLFLVRKLSDGVCCSLQGSILEPLFFALYVNDMSIAVNCDLCLCADDSMLQISGKDVKQIEKDQTVLSSSSAEGAVACRFTFS